MIRQKQVFAQVAKTAVMSERYLHISFVICLGAKSRLCKECGHHRFRRLVRNGESRPATCGVRVLGRNGDRIDRAGRDGSWYRCIRIRRDEQDHCHGRPARWDRPRRWDCYSPCRPSKAAMQILHACLAQRAPERCEIARDHRFAKHGFKARQCFERGEIGAAHDQALCRGNIDRETMFVDRCHGRASDTAVLVRPADADSQPEHAQCLDAAVCEKVHFVVIQRIVIGRRKGDPLEPHHARREDERWRGRNGRNAGDLEHEVGESVDRRHHRTGGARVDDDVHAGLGEFSASLSDVVVQRSPPVQAGGVGVQRHARHMHGHALGNQACPCRLVHRMGRRNDDADLCAIAIRTGSACRAACSGKRQGPFAVSSDEEKAIQPCEDQTVPKTMAGSVPTPSPGSCAPPPSHSSGSRAG